jgi:sugar transferase EpsL
MMSQSQGGGTPGDSMPPGFSLDPARPIGPWAMSPRKRSIDVIASGVGLIALSPVMAVTALLVRRNLGAPVFFSQERPGQGGRVFRIHKFRSMTNATDAHGRLLPPEERLTRFGRLLRSTSLDELPELVNVLTGTMSLVGPRPLRVEYTAHYTPEQARRLLVRPGITGPAQVRGRNLLSWEERFEQDVAYVDSASSTTDLKVLFATILGVVRRHGVEPEGAAVVAPFSGTSLES